MSLVEVTPGRKVKVVEDASRSKLIELFPAKVANNAVPVAIICVVMVTFSIEMANEPKVHTSNWRNDGLNVMWRF